MIQRFLYHFFWNFYDYLGTYLLIGSVSALSLLFIVSGSGTIAGPAFGAMKFVILAVLLLLAWIVLAATLAGLMPFAMAAARDVTPRLPFFLRELRGKFGRYALLVAAIMAIVIVGAANVFFYFRMSHTGAGGLAMVGTILGATFFWLILGFMTYSTVLLTAATVDEQVGFRPLTRRAFMALALAPGLWFVTMLTIAVGTALCLFSRVGIVFILPGIATAASTAFRIVEQHAEYLAEAREEIGADQPLAAYKKKALSLAMDWELRQPRRTLRELIKPWEY